MEEKTFLDWLGLGEFWDLVKSFISEKLSNKIDSSLIGAASGVAPLGEDGLVPSDYLPSSSHGGGAFDFDTYSNTTGYGYTYNSSTMTETITYDGSTFATRVNAKNSDGSWTVTTTCDSMGVASTKTWTKDSNGNWSSADV